MKQTEASIHEGAAVITAFFATLYRDVEDGWLVLSHPDTARVTQQGKPVLVSDWLDVAQTSWEAIGAAAAQLAHQYNVYFGVALQHPDRKPARFKRSQNSTAYLVPGLWYDLDLAYGHHAASALPATDAEALDFLRTFQSPPSLIIHSGGGLYGHWLFKEPYRITSEAEHETITQLCKQFAYTITMAGTDRGWTLDSLGDLARVLRPPGTINHKYGKPVQVLHEGAERYNPSDFDWLLALPAPAKTTHAGMAIPGQPDLVRIAEHYGCALVRKTAAELEGAQPTHGSSTGDNFNVNPSKGVWHCWRHGTGGDALALIAVCEGLLDCDQAVSGAIRGDLFKRVVTVANEQFQAGIVLESTRHWNGPTPDPGTASPDPPLPYSDYTNALAFVREHGQDLRYCYPWQVWLVWTGTHWHRDTSGAVMRRAKQTIKRRARRVEAMDDADAKALMAHIKSSLSTAKLEALVRNAQSEPGMQVQPDDLDQDLWALNCANGTLDLQTGVLRAHSQADCITKCLPTAYDPEAPCPTWDAFLWRIMGGSQGPADPETMSALALDIRQKMDDRARNMIAYLQRIVGYTLTGSTREQCMFLCHGPTKTGKSTYLATLRRLLGPYGKQTDIQTFMHKDRPEVRNDLADLAGARYVYAVESQEGKRLAEGLVKQMTGGVDGMKARFLYEELFEFQPQFKAYLGTNHLPIIKGSDDAIWERIRRIPFIVQIPKEDRDKTLEETLANELPGILAWAVRGCLEWQRLNDLHEPEPVVEAGNDYRSKMDDVGRFLTEACIVGDPETYKTQAQTLLKAYHTWCGPTTMSGKAFATLLTEKGYESKRYTTGMFWLGIGLPAPEETQQDEEANV
jgi:putative DNA primase/helicase